MRAMTNPAPVTGLRRHPYRIFFPLGWLMTWVGLLPWVMYAWLGSSEYPRNLHSLVLIQGALTSFAVGFLYTMLPRRLDAPAPTSWQLWLAVLTPPLHAILVWQEQLALAHGLWCLLALTMVGFTASRIYGSNAGRRGPIAFAWIPLAWGFGLAGAGLQAIYSSQPVGDVGLIVLATESVAFGWILLTHGLFTSLILGVGGLFLPLVLHKQSSIDADQVPDARRRQRWHMLAAVVLLFSFAGQATGWEPQSLIARAATVLLVLLLIGGIHRPPTVAGTQRKLIWLASWCLPIGLALAAAVPSRPQIGLHVFFLGGIALITLTVALHVGLAHSTGQDLVFKPVLQTQLFGLLAGIALILRIIAEIDMIHRFDWLGAAATVMMLALVPWGQLVLTRLVPSIGKP